MLTPLGRTASGWGAAGERVSRRSFRGLGVVLILLGAFSTVHGPAGFSFTGKEPA
jgi:hypothetical protein